MLAPKTFPKDKTDSWFTAEKIPTKNSGKLVAIARKIEDIKKTGILIFRPIIRISPTENSVALIKIKRPKANAKMGNKIIFPFRTADDKDFPAPFGWLSVLEICRDGI